MDTEFAASGESREAVEILLDANRWMIIQNAITKVMHWDLVGCLLLVKSSFYPTPSLYLDVSFLSLCLITSKSSTHIVTTVLTSCLIKSNGRHKIVPGTHQISWEKMVIFVNGRICGVIVWHFVHDKSDWKSHVLC